MAVLTYTKAGAKATIAAKLDNSIFDVVPGNHEVLKSAYVAYLANGRTAAGNTKTRGEVSGGGRKPWKQKGTGRARFGSSRVPIWRGGGITFGPTGNENYSHKMPAGTKRLAVRQALSIAANEGSLIILEAFDCSAGKVAPTINLLQKIGTKGSVLIAVDSKDAMTARATDNLLDVKVVQVKYLNVFDILNADYIVMTKDALAIAHEWLAAKSESSSQIGDKK